tara:strand:+ start:312 stop:644 length:333 start_codon:yes stop_codon:yes gene_type:complete
MNGLFLTGSSLDDMFDGAYSIFDDVAEGGGFDQLKDRASDLDVEEVVKPKPQKVARKTSTPKRKKVEGYKNKTVNTSSKRGRGRQSGVKGKCGNCGITGHYKNTCPKYLP